MCNIQSNYIIPVKDNIESNIITCHIRILENITIDSIYL